MDEERWQEDRCPETTGEVPLEDGYVVLVPFVVAL